MLPEVILSNVQHRSKWSEVYIFVIYYRNNKYSNFFRILANKINAMEPQNVEQILPWRAPRHNRAGFTQWSNRRTKNDYGAFRFESQGKVKSVGIVASRAWTLLKNRWNKGFCKLIYLRILNLLYTSTCYK